MEQRPCHDRRPHAGVQFEHDYSNVYAAVQKFDIKYPVALDNDYSTGDAYGNQYWPAEYLIDKNGNVRYVSFGEGDYNQTGAGNPRTAQKCELHHPAEPHQRSSRRQLLVDRHSRDLSWLQYRKGSDRQSGRLLLRDASNYSFTGKMRTTPCTSPARGTAHQME